MKKWRKNLAWTVRFRDRAKQDLKRLDRSVQTRIYRFLLERISGTEDPRRFGKALKGDHTGLWRYRVGDYRIICSILDEEIQVVVVMVGHRRDVYR